mmetsp:Transcript_1811/g.1705  ORF Transcript_1811/g.1705 Transcript_1811/m.1705 type:complete len:101 (-) Transcript_1811:56-358(-)
MIETEDLSKFMPKFEEDEEGNKSEGNNSFDYEDFKKRYSHLYEEAVAGNNDNGDGSSDGNSSFDFERYKQEHLDLLRKSGQKGLYDVKEEDFEESVGVHP